MTCTQFQICRHFGSHNILGNASRENKNVSRQLVLAPRLVNLAFPIPLYGSLKRKGSFVPKVFRIYRQMFLTFVESETLELSYTLNYVMKRANDLKTISDSICFRGASET